MEPKRRKLLLSETEIEAVKLARNVTGAMKDIELKKTEDPDWLTAEVRQNHATWLGVGNAYNLLGDILDRWAKAPAESTYGTGVYEARESKRNPQGDYVLVRNIAANETAPGVPGDNLMVLQNGDGECFVVDTDTDPEWKTATGGHDLGTSS